MKRNKSLLVMAALTATVFALLIPDINRAKNKDVPVVVAPVIIKNNISKETARNYSIDSGEQEFQHSGLLTINF